MKKLPIAEWFHSLQGEGVWALTPMLFIRTAGCNVGGSPEYGSCWTADGREFQCDTDYRKKLEYTLDELIHRAANDQPVLHVCITGGEPFLHDLSEVRSIPGCSFHFETSGTLPLPAWVEGFSRNNDPYWVACSPKRGFLLENRPLISEWKFLVDQEFLDRDPEGSVQQIVGESPAPVFLQPINDVHTISQRNVKLCQQLLQQHPSWRLSLQTHKILGIQ